MTIVELKKEIEEYKRWLKEEGDGCEVVFSNTGPANMGLIDSLLRVIEKQNSRIEALESRLK